MRYIKTFEGHIDSQESKQRLTDAQIPVDIENTDTTDKKKDRIIKRMKDHQKNVNSDMPIPPTEDDFQGS